MKLLRPAQGIPSASAGRRPVRAHRSARAIAALEPPKIDGGNGRRKGGRRKIKLVSADRGRRQAAQDGGNHRKSVVGQHPVPRDATTELAQFDGTDEGDPGGRRGTAQHDRRDDRCGGEQYGRPTLLPPAPRGANDRERDPERDACRGRRDVADRERRCDGRGHRNEEVRRDQGDKRDCDVCPHEHCDPAARDGRSRRVPAAVAVYRGDDRADRLRGPRWRPVHGAVRRPETVVRVCALLHGGHRGILRRLAHRASRRVDG